LKQRTNRKKDNECNGWHFGSLAVFGQKWHNEGLAKHVPPQTNKMFVAVATSLQKGGVKGRWGKTWKHCSSHGVRKSDHGLKYGPQNDVLVLFYPSSSPTPIAPSMLLIGIHPCPLPGGVTNASKCLGGWECVHCGLDAGAKAFPLAPCNFVCSQCAFRLSAVAAFSQTSVVCKTCKLDRVNNDVVA
jgi:hypothetical protein